MSRPSEAPARRGRARRRPRGSRRVWVLTGVGIVLLVVGCAVWLGIRGVLAQREVAEAQRLAKVVQTQVAGGQTDAVRGTAEQLASHVDAAQGYVGDPVWQAAAHLPVVGSNFSTVSSLAEILGTVTHGAVLPLADVTTNLSPSALRPAHGAINLQPLVAARPALTQADAVLRDATSRAGAINPGFGTLPQVTDGLDRFKSVLSEAAQQISAADNAMSVLPAMLGNDSPRTYLVLFQNNAELRATGGIPGAAAEVHVDHGRIALGRQAAAKEISMFENPVLPLTDQTLGLYGPIVGQYLQDVNLTPQFPLSAQLAAEMWKRHFGTRVDGVVSLDPVALGYLLNATGPVKLPNGQTVNSGNAVKVLLSDAYAEFNVVQQKDSFFSAAAAAVFEKVAAGGFQPKPMLDAMGRAAAERRLLVWSATPREQDAIATAGIAGWPPAKQGQRDVFGVYLNDATGAKMDYYLREAYRTGGVMCRQDGRPTWQVEVTLTNTAPADAATSLPEYVTGGGQYGVPPGDVKTLINVYAPPSAIFVGATHDSAKIDVHRDADSGYPVAQTDVLLKPGASTTLRFQFLGAPNSALQPGVVSTPTVNMASSAEMQLSCNDVLR